MSWKKVVLGLVAAVVVSAWLAMAIALVIGPKAVGISVWTGIVVFATVSTEGGIWITAAAKRKQAALRHAMRRAMLQTDVLRLPVMATPAFTFEEVKANAVICGERTLDIALATTGFTDPFNVTGQPATALPVAMSQSTMPISVQSVGRLFEEAVVLRVAKVLETAAAFDLLPPMFR